MRPFNPVLYNWRNISHDKAETAQYYKIFSYYKGALSICDPNLIHVLVRVPYLIADFLLVLLPAMGTATAEEDDGNNEKEQEYSNYGSCNDARSVWGWTTQGRHWLEGSINVLQQVYN